MCTWSPLATGEVINPTNTVRFARSAAAVVRPIAQSPWEVKAETSSTGRLIYFDIAYRKVRFDHRNASVAEGNAACVVRT